MEEEKATMARKDYEPECYLCPGNKRAGGEVNPEYESTFVFKNDFSALLPQIPEVPRLNSNLFLIEDVTGECRVICFSPRHDVTLPEMSVTEIHKVVDLWVEQSKELAKNYLWVQVFENKGEIMGCSNPHPHGQIWASSSIPNEPLKEMLRQNEYYNKNKRNLLLDYLDEELQKKERIVVENDHWVVLVPFWAIWPFETLMLPKFQISRIQDLEKNEMKSLALILKQHLVKYDNLFKTSFPYTMGWHSAPNDSSYQKSWQLHAHFYPPLLRSADVKKFMVGYEMLAEAQRDITPEQAADTLKNLSNIHHTRGE
jgi:UDPglucose--hexose-1-phosphate uridylyltransferase